MPEPLRPTPRQKPREITGRFIVKLNDADHPRPTLSLHHRTLPRFDVNPNTNQPMNNNPLVRPAQNTLYTDAQHPSHIVIH